MATDLEKKIVQQMEYYFGDINLTRDKFMREKIQEDDGWITLEIMLSFGRLASLTTDAAVIVEALKKAESNLVVVSDDGTKVRRSPDNPLPEAEQFRKELMARTAYAKGFPLDEELDEIVKLLETHGPIEAVMRRTYLDKISKERKFKGSCFIIFKDIELCKKFVEADSIEYKDTELIRKWQADYIEEKRNEIDNRKKNKQSKQKANVVAEQKKPSFPKGAVLHFTGIKDDQMLTWEEIKEKVKEVADIDASYIDFRKGDLEGYIRLPAENSAVEFHKKLTDSKLTIGNIDLVVKVLEGEEEEEFLKKAAESVSQRREKQKGNKKQNRKRKGNFNDNGPKSKKNN